MEKKVYSIPEQDIATFKYKRTDITTKTYIDPVDQSLFVRDYISNLFKDDDLMNNYMIAEWSLILGIVDKMTDIPVNEEKDNIDLSLIISSGMWDEIKDHIYNYSNFKMDLDKIVDLIKWQKSVDKSVGTILEGLSDKAFLLLDRISKMDLSEDGIKRLLASFEKVTDDFNDKFTAKPKSKKRTKETE